MTEPIPVGVIGAGGKLGRAASDWIEESQEFQLSAIIKRGSSWSPLERVVACLDVTRAGLGALHAERLLEMGVRPVVGTSGVTSGELQALRDLASSNGLGGAVVPNFSVGFLAMARAASAAAGLLPDVQITEAHRPEKLDAPSGTASKLCATQGVPLEEVITLRMRGVTAFHEYKLWGSDDVVTIRHESHGLLSFKEGLLASLRYACKSSALAYGLEEVMGGACIVSP